MKALSIIKIGGNIIDSPENLQTFLKDFASIEGLKILVHGGGKLATEIGSRLGIAPNYVQGRRITDEATIELVTMVYGGLINKKIIAALQALSCDAIGLTGADGNTISATRRPVDKIDFGFVGDVTRKGVNSNFIAQLLNAGLTPVFAPLTHDGQGQMLNTNADTIAQELAAALSKAFQVRLIYCFEKAGVLRNPSDETSVIPQIDKSNFEKLLAEGIISEGMIPKLSNAFTALDAGVSAITIGHAKDLKHILLGKKGTKIL
ncbi:MAG: acetylglutamate kinase [Chitinophagaceae bacterium]